MWVSFADVLRTGRRRTGPQSANNITAQSKRAVSTAIIVAFGGVGGIFATTVFRERDFPKYIPGLWATIGCQVRVFTLLCMSDIPRMGFLWQFLMLVLLAITTFYFKNQNRKLRDGKLSFPIEEQVGFSYTLWKKCSSEFIPFPTQCRWMTHKMILPLLFPFGFPVDYNLEGCLLESRQRIPNNWLTFDPSSVLLVTHKDYVPAVY